MTPAAAQAALNEGLIRIQEEAAGAVHLTVVRPIDVLDILVAAMAGSGEAASLLTALNQAADRIEKAPRRSPMLCASCPQPLRGAGFSFVLALPARSDPMQAISLGVCTGCATEPEDITAKAISSLRKIWPDIRPISVTHQDGGRA